MDEKEIKSLLDAAIEEIEYALISNKSKDVKEYYLRNAIRYITVAKEKNEKKLNQTDNNVK